MKLSFQFNRFNWPGSSAEIGERSTAIIQHVEQAGFDTLWAMDHFFQMEMGNRVAEENMLEGYTLLAYAAGLTKRIRLGLLVTGVTYRYPGILVKTVTTLDVLSGGRAWLGIGAAWYDREHAALGVPYPPTKERFERLEETLQIALQMWSDDDGPYDGRHYHLAETINHPQSVQRPHPPILIGGTGEQKTLRLVAKYADACNFFDSPDLEHKLQVLRERCAEIGRPYEEIEKTVLSGVPMDTNAALESLERLAALGVDQVMLATAEAPELAEIDFIGANVLPEATKIKVAGR